MSYCSKCGKRLDREATFCSQCGSPVGAKGRVSSEARHVAKKRQEACFGPPGSGGGIWGAMSFGVFIIGLAILWLFNWLWPGILLLIGLMLVIGALVAYSKR